MFCADCGKEVSEGDTFCRYCGRSLSASKADPQHPVVTALPPHPKSKFGLILALVSVPIIGAIFYVPFALTHISKRAEQRTVVEDLITISRANEAYAATYNHGYAASLAALGRPKGSHLNPTDIANPNRPDASGLIDSVLAAGTEDGYRFTYSAGPKKHGQIDTYTVRADPTSPDEKWHYFTDESGVIRMEYGRQANGESTPIIDEPSK